MTSDDDLMAAFDARAQRRAERREFFTRAAGMAAVGGLMVSGAGRVAAQTPTPTPSPTSSPTPTGTPTPTFSDVDVLNFALNLEYLEANFYAFAITGSAIAADLQTGITTAGAQGAATGGRQVTFATPSIRQYAAEIAADELAHVKFLRATLSTLAVAQPAIDLGVTATSAFSRAAQAAGVVPAGTAFDAYANEETFLLAAYIFEDTGVTAYKGAAPLILNKQYVEASAGILAVEAYHAAMVRSLLFTKGIDPNRAAGALDLIGASEQISDARDTLDGAPKLDLVLGRGPDDDQGVRPISTADGEAANIAPLNPNGLVYTRTPQQVLNIVYLNGGAAVGTGGFFPAGMNGTIKTTAAASTT